MAAFYSAATAIEELNNPIVNYNVMDRYLSSGCVLLSNFSDAMPTDFTDKIIFFFPAAILHYSYTYIVCADSTQESSVIFLDVSCRINSTFINFNILAHRYNHFHTCYV